MFLYHNLCSVSSMYRYQIFNKDFNPLITQKFWPIAKHIKHKIPLILYCKNNVHGWFSELYSQSTLFRMSLELQKKKLETTHITINFKLLIASRFAARNTMYDIAVSAC